MPDTGNAKDCQPQICIFYLKKRDLRNKLTAKTVDEDPASCKRWISRKEIKSERRTRSPKTTAKLI